MRRVRQILRRVRHLVGRGSFEADLEEELRFHMEMSASLLARSGHSAADVNALVHREFGSMAQYQDEVRDARGLTFVDDLRRDVRFALRTLVRTPAFTIIALVTF